MKCKQRAKTSLSSDSPSFRRQQSSSVRLFEMIQNLHALPLRRQSVVTLFPLLMGFIFILARPPSHAHTDTVFQPSYPAEHNTHSKAPVTPTHTHAQNGSSSHSPTATRVRSTNQPARGNIYTNERGRDAHRAGEGRGGRPPHDSQQRYFFFCEIALFSDGPKRYLRCPTGYIFTFKSLPIWSANDRRHSRKLKQTDYGRIFALFVVALNTHVC